MKKSMWQEFKEFISRGSVMDLAVGVIMGGAFTSIVNSLVNDIIMPGVGVLLGGLNFAELKYTMTSLDGTVVEIMYGNFIQAIVNFIIVAFVIFLIVKAINNIHRKKQEEPAPEVPAEPSEDILLLREIRDSLKK